MQGHFSVAIELVVPPAAVVLLARVQAEPDELLGHIGRLGLTNRVDGEVFRYVLRFDQALLSSLSSTYATL